MFPRSNCLIIVYTTKTLAALEWLVYWQKNRRSRSRTAERVGKDISGIIGQISNVIAEGLWSL